MELGKICRLNFLFDKDLLKALQIVERGRITCYIAERSQRKVFQVCKAVGPSVHF